MFEKIEAKDLKFFEENLNHLVQGEISFEEMVSKTVSPALLHIIAVLVNESYGNDNILAKILANPYCGAKTIVYIQTRNMDVKWDDMIRYGDIEDSYSKEQLLDIVREDEYCGCSLGIIECKNYDADVFYRMFEIAKNGVSKDPKIYKEIFGTICAIALIKRHMTPDMVEEVLDNFLNAEYDSLIDEVVLCCEEEYLDKVMSQIVSKESPEYTVYIRELCTKRKGSK